MKKKFEIIPIQEFESIEKDSMLYVLGGAADPNFSCDDFSCSTFNGGTCDTLECTKYFCTCFVGPFSPKYTIDTCKWNFGPIQPTP